MRIVALLAVCSIGCVTRSLATSRPSAPRVEVEGTVLSASRSAFRSQAESAWATGGARAVDALVRLYPDRALEWLRSESTATPSSGPPRLALASVETAYDGALGAEGRAAVERDRARGLAALDAGRVDEARAAFEEARTRARAAEHRHLAFELSVLLADPRLAGKTDAAVADGRGVCDPGLWHRLLDAWTAPPQPALHGELAWMELRRNEPEAALLDFRKAEAFSSDPKEKERMRLGQARALLLLSRRGEALVLLVPLTSSSVTETERGALAISAVIASEMGDLDAAEKALRRALRDDAEWPGRARARFDLGAALLARGDDAQGLETLRAAEKEMLAAGDSPGAVRALRTEARYLEARGRDDEAKAAGTRAASLALETGVRADR